MNERLHAIVAVSLHPYTAMFCRCGKIIVDDMRPSQWEQAAQTHVREGNDGL